MVYRGHVQEGKVVFDENVDLPEGAEVEVILRDDNASASEHRPIEEVIAEIASRIPESEWAKLPPDLNDQLDHYVYGTPKQ